MAKNKNSGGHEYKPNESVQIIAGKYRDHRFGTFIRYAGSVSADVKIRNDSVSVRCIRLSSIAPIASKAEKQAAEGDGESLVIPRVLLVNAIKDLQSNADTEAKLEGVIAMMEELLRNAESEDGGKDGAKNRKTRE